MTTKFFGVKAVSLKNSFTEKNQFALWNFNIVFAIFYFFKKYPLIKLEMGTESTVKFLTQEGNQKPNWFLEPKRKPRSTRK